MELIAAGHGDNDFFMDLSRSQMALASRRHSLSFFFFRGRQQEPTTGRNVTWNEGATR